MLGYDCTLNDIMFAVPCIPNKMQYTIACNIYNFEDYPIGADYTAVDINFSVVRKARRVSKSLGRDDISCEVGNATKLAFADNSFDVGILSYVLSAVPDQEAAYAEIQRIVSPGGRIGIVDFSNS